MVNFAAADPRNLQPSRADPEHRSRRKELEKKHGYGYTEPLILAAIGVGLIWNIENQVQKRSERKDEEEKQEKEREERRRKRKEDQRRAGAWQPGDDGGNRDRSAAGRYDDPRGGRERDYYRDEPRRDFRDEPRRIEYHTNEYRGYRDEYRDYHNDYRYADRRDGSVRRSNRRDSF